MIANRVVLDTNVCLDLFVFRDPRWQALLEALKSGRIHAVTRTDCRREWQIVLHYPHLRLDEPARMRSACEFDELIPCVSDEIAGTPMSLEQPPVVRLPVCRDPDDQKFLELAHNSRAQLLITKDKALLKLARRNAKAGLFRIIAPDAWQPTF